MRPQRRRPPSLISVSLVRWSKHKAGCWVFVAVRGGLNPHLLLPRKMLWTPDHGQGLVQSTWMSSSWHWATGQVGAEGVWVRRRREDSKRASADGICFGREGLWRTPLWPTFLLLFPAYIFPFHATQGTNFRWTAGACSGPCLAHSLVPRYNLGLWTWNRMWS